MVKEVEKETEQFGQKITTDPEPEPEPKTPTAEEQLVTLQEKLDTATKEREEFKTGLSTAHSKLTKADQKLNKQADIQAQIDELKELQKMGFALMADQGKMPEEGFDAEKRQDLSKQFDTKVNELEQKRLLREAQGKMVGYQERTEALGLTEDDPEYWDIQDAATNFKFQKTEALLKRLEKLKEAEKTTDTKETKVESEEDKVNKQVDEKLRQEMEKRGMLESEHGGPSAASQTDAKVMEAYLKNSNDPKAYADMVALYNRKGGRL